MKEETPNKKLINEKIVGRKLTFTKVMRFLVLAIVCGLLFGAMAALSFTWVRKGNTVSEETSAVQSALPAGTEGSVAALESTAEDIPEEEVTETSSDTEEEDPETTGAGNSSEEETSETEPDEETSEEETAEDPESTDHGSGEEETAESAEAGETESEESGEEVPDYAETMIALQKKVVEMTQPYIVTVNAITTGNTWFESPVESTQSFAGIILDVTEEEILILSTAGPTASETLRVTFYEGPTADAYVKQFSMRDDLAVLAVPFEEEVSEDLLSAFSGIVPADSFSAGVGDPVIAVGAPLGVVNSCSFGSVGYVSTDEPALDSAQRILYADIRTDADKGSFILDKDGELLGIAGKQDERSGLGAGLARIITIGSVKNLVDLMEAGEKQAYIGLEGFGVSAEMISDGLPEGMYITNVYTESPAYNAGIKRGDIITVLNEVPVRDAYEYADVMRTLKPEETISLVVQRGSADGEYRAIDFMLTTGER